MSYIRTPRILDRNVSIPSSVPSCVMVAQYQVATDYDNARLARLHASKAAQMVRSAALCRDIALRTPSCATSARQSMRFYAIRWRDYAHVS